VWSEGGPWNNGIGVLAPIVHFVFDCLKLQCRDLHLCLHFFVYGRFVGHGTVGEGVSAGFVVTVYDAISLYCLKLKNSVVPTRC